MRDPASEEFRDVYEWVRERKIERVETPTTTTMTTTCRIVPNGVGAMFVIHNTHRRRFARSHEWTQRQGEYMLCWCCALSLCLSPHRSGVFRGRWMVLDISGVGVVEQRGMGCDTQSWIFRQTVMHIEIALENVVVSVAFVGLLRMCHVCEWNVHKQRGALDDVVCYDK